MKKKRIKKKKRQAGWGAGRVSAAGGAGRPLGAFGLLARRWRVDSIRQQQISPQVSIFLSNNEVFHKFL